jgi:hypothetical protein
MDANRTYLLAQNGVPGESVACTPLSLLRQSPAQDPATTMQRRDSLDSLDSLAHEKAEAHTASAPRSGLRSTLSKVARRPSSAGKGKQLIVGQVAVASGSMHEHEPLQVYVIGDQVVYLGPESNRCSRKESKEKRERIMNAEIERVMVAKDKRLSAGHWHYDGVASDARLMSRVS